MSSFRPGKTNAPRGYVPGLGRGAAGFTTRSDIGPAAPEGVAAVGVGGSRAAEARAMKLAATPFGVAPKGYIPGAGRGAGGPAGEDEGPTGYDPFEGYDDRRVDKSPYDDDDEEADRIYEEIDERMNAKRKRTENKEVSADARQMIELQFRELKEKLADVTEDEWASIPDVGDYR